MLICLEKELTREVIKALAEKGSSGVICLGQEFTGNDQLKTNAIQTKRCSGFQDSLKIEE
jgi:adenine-specific DNA-methyltransferase